MQTLKFLKVQFNAYGQTGGWNLKLVVKPIKGACVTVWMCPINVTCSASSESWVYQTVINASNQALCEFINKRFKDFESEAKQLHENTAQIDQAIERLTGVTLVDSVKVSLVE